MEYKTTQSVRDSKRRWYEKNKEKYLVYSKRTQDAWREKMRVLKSVPCVDCHMTYPPYVMDFDHRPGEVKVMAVSQLYRYKSTALIEAEIAKCDVVCANCHRIRTHARRLAAKDAVCENLPTRRGSERGVKPRPEKQLSL